ncbi:MAG: hypothetical protein AAGB51_02405 [Planctomycetota bacterium]
MRAHHARTLALCTLAVLPGTAAAQQDTDLEDRSLRQIEDALRQRPEPAGPLDAERAPPVGPVTPGIGPNPTRWLDGAVSGSIVPGGTLIARRGASVFQAPTGEWVAVFDAGPEGSRTLPPMVLLPTRSRERLEVLAASQVQRDDEGLAEGVLVLGLTGEVTLYRGRNYFLLTSFTRPEHRAPPELIEPEPAPTDAEPTESEVSTRLQDDPDVASLIRDLEERRSTPRGLQNPVRDPESVLDTDELDAEQDERRSFITIRDGVPISRLTGRLVRSGAGEPVFASDSGIGSGGRGLGSGGTEGPMVLLPNAVTQRLENLAGARGDGAQLEISGRLYVYDRRAYVLPSFYRLVAPSDIAIAE